MSWGLVPALVAAGLMTALGATCIARPSALRIVGVTSDTPLGTSEIRAVFGGMFFALGLACIVLRQPIVFAVVGAAWLTDVAVRVAAVFADRVPAKDALPVLGIGLGMGAALLSGYWVA